jgi:hypothetical protein
MITYFSAPITSPKRQNEPLSVTAQTNVVAGKCSTSQHNRAGEAKTLIIYASTFHPDYNLDYASQAD